MTLDFVIAERRLKNTSRLVHQSMWLLFLIAVGLMIVVRRSASAHPASLWMLGGAVLAFMVSFALRDFLRKVLRRYTEDKIVHDVKIFLEREPAPAVAQPAPTEVPVKPASPANAVPSRPAGFVPLKGAADHRTPVPDPVMFDAIPSHESVGIKTDFYAVLLPVVHTC
jgi:uncharacterized protein (DUF58 family)